MMVKMEDGNKSLVLVVLSFCFLWEEVYLLESFVGRCVSTSFRDALFRFRVARCYRWSICCQSGSKQVPLVKTVKSFQGEIRQVCLLPAHLGKHETLLVHWYGMWCRNSHATIDEGGQRRAQHDRKMRKSMQHGACAWWWRRRGRKLFGAVWPIKTRHMSSDGEGSQCVLHLWFRNNQICPADPTANGSYTVSVYKCI